MKRVFVIVALLVACDKKTETQAQPSASAAASAAPVIVDSGPPKNE